MPVPERLTTYINSKQLQYSHILHPPAYSAEDVAHAVHCPKHRLAKSIALHIDGREVLAILPASDKLDMKKLKDVLDASKVTLFSEAELMDYFKDCQVGSTPIFGELYGIETIVSTSLLEDSEIYFNAGTHTDVMKCSLNDFLEISRPLLADISSLHKDNFVCRELGY